MSHIALSPKGQGTAQKISTGFIEKLGGTDSERTGNRKRGRRKERGHSGSRDSLNKS